MKKFFDLHRHDEFSFFDGFGKARELAKHAKELGYDALGISNHGNISGLVRHWKACKDEGIKPIFGCEVYFQPVFNKENPKREKFHLCLFVKNYEGYRNLCRMLTEANKDQFYFTPTVDFKLLEKYHDGLICTTACIQGYLSHALRSGADKMAEKALSRLIRIFGEDLYIEIQPYSIDDESTQEQTNVKLLDLADLYGAKAIMTSDSHYGRKEDFDTYCKMHEIAGHDLDWVTGTYSTRYMPSEGEIVDRFAEMHEPDFEGEIFTKAIELNDNLQILKDSVDNDIFEKCKINLPKLGNEKSSHDRLVDLTKRGLKKRGKYNKEYIDRAKMELDVIHFHDFDDYFLMVQEYVCWAKKNGVEVGDGRGSACNCLVAYAIGITDVDSILYGLDFSRFMRKGKKKMPDIDVDFETSKRASVINHVLERYPDKSVRICSYGEYDVDGLINDLAKVCGLPIDGETDVFDRDEHKKVIAEIKHIIHAYQDGGEVDLILLKKDPRYKEINSEYDNIMKHFTLLYKKVRHLGSHAAGVAVTGGSVEDYTCQVRRKSGKDFYFSSCYDLNDLESINCIKFDMLGLQTLSEIRELREFSNYAVKEDDLNDAKIYTFFRDGKTDGIFQMEKSTPKKILSMIQCSNQNDVIAVNALNRPAPLQLKMHETFAENKLSGKVDAKSPYYQYTKETYGTMLYQEQTIEVAKGLGHLTDVQSFDLLKIMKKESNLIKPEYVPIIEQMRKDFFLGCKSEGLTKEQTRDIWNSMLIYGFNKGHSVGYGRISIKQMYYKVYYPAIFWYVKIKYARNDSDFYKFTRFAILDQVVVFLPHVNHTALTSLKKQSGEYVIWHGLNTVKGIGLKAAEAIEEERKRNGCFKSRDEFLERCKGQKVNKKVIDALDECGALQFNQKKYVDCVIKYNSIMAVRK